MSGYQREPGDWDAFHGDMPDGFGEAMRQVSWLACNMARKAGGPARGIEADDVAQEGFAALVGAARRFDRTRNVPFGAYAMIRAKGAMADYIRGQTGGRRRTHLEIVAEEDMDGIASVEIGPEERAVMKAEAEALDESILGLEPKRQAAVQARMAGRRLREIAAEQGLSVTRVAELLWSASRKVRRELRDRDVL